MLPRSHRLPALEMRAVMRSGTRIHYKGITLTYLTDKDILSKKQAQAGGKIRTNPRFSFVVSTKVDKHAVGRNRIRRMLSESVRHVLNHISPSIGGIFIGSKDLVGLTQRDIETRVEELLKKSNLYTA